MSTSIKTAIVGYGYSAKTFHIPFITNLSSFEFVAISSSKADEVKKDFPDVVCYPSPIELIEQTDAELIIITSPNDTHYPLAKHALNHGKHVLVEKPFVTHSKDGQELVELAKDKGLSLAVYHNRRWDSDFRTVKSLIESGQLGNIRWFETHFDRFRPDVQKRWREDPTVDGAGILFDLGPHLLDQVVQLFGMPIAITAQVECLREDNGSDDFFNILLKYPTHYVQVHSTPYCAGETLRYKVMGDKAQFVKIGLDPQEDKLVAGSGYLLPKWSVDTEEKWGIYSDQNEEYKVEPTEGGYENFYLKLADAIRNNGTVPATGEESLCAIKLIELARLSSQEKRTVDLV
ncbi:oxidoreductase [Vibrio sp.]|uniref:Oxidoreductase n=1 Tax=Vibrio viridaestus TaxID=2487322 RepID=A0A3N9TY23_9VIBR|nr:oxidoreductase [Vibrio viridaestus]MDC0611472.1 oxidoreductase [Vibrio sp.]RQW61832.1 oxidoreductase [Vibrio viridaestus]